MRDTLTRAVEGDDEALQLIIDNVNTYVEVVHHTDYTLALMQCEYTLVVSLEVQMLTGLPLVVGLSLANLTRKTADIHHGRFDPSPLLLLACTLIQHNKANSRVRWQYLCCDLRLMLLAGPFALSGNPSSVFFDPLQRIGR